MDKVLAFLARDCGFEYGLGCTSLAQWSGGCIFTQAGSLIHRIHARSVILVYSHMNYTYSDDVSCEQ